MDVVCSLMIGGFGEPVQNLLGVEIFIVELSFDALHSILKDIFQGFLYLLFDLSLSEQNHFLLFVEFDYSGETA